jgi:hypothetical protein
MAEFSNGGGGGGGGSSGGGEGGGILVLVLVAVAAAAAAAMVVVQHLEAATITCKDTSGCPLTTEVAAHTADEDVTQLHTPGSAWRRRLIKQLVEKRSTFQQIRTFTDMFKKLALEYHPAAFQSNPQLHAL